MSTEDFQREQVKTLQEINTQLQIENKKLAGDNNYLQVENSSLRQTLDDTNERLNTLKIVVARV